jgi:hypothetical protein
MIPCSTDRPWGLHAPLRSDEDCSRCGWTAPGPIGDALADAAFAAEAMAKAEELGWAVIEGGPLPDTGQADESLAA